ncbi:MAG: hypothetical protein ACLSWY_05960 [Ruthenibacterium lactatiformans]
MGGVLAASLTKELLHAGFESASTARLVNIALALKSDDESAVALDALSIDLYTGDAVLYKAGAAASFLLRTVRPPFTAATRFPSAFSAA